MLPIRQSAFATAPLSDVVAVLLRQLRRPLAAHGVKFTDAEAVSMGSDLVARHPGFSVPPMLKSGLAAVIAESEAVLAGLGLVFPASLDQPMEAVPGWTTTSEFLELANEKANAELRIGAAAALELVCGVDAHRPHLLALAARPADDVDGILARRVLNGA